MHGQLTANGYLCDGCNVREGHEHRCHGRDGGPLCQCPECIVECDGCGRIANEREARSWSFSVPRAEDGLPTVLCPACVATEAEASRWVCPACGADISRNLSGDGHAANCPYLAAQETGELP